MPITIAALAAILVFDVDASADPAPAPAFDASPSLAQSGAPDAPKHGSLQLNPLSALIGQYGATVEVLPRPHHALTLTAYYANTSSVDPVSLAATPDSQYERTYFVTRLRGVGGEIGYRYYVGGSGPHGVFFGPSLLAGTYSADSERQKSITGFQKIGGAFDVGYQAIFGDLVIGAGVGLQFTAPLQHVDDQGLTVAVHSEAALRPRVLASIGYAF